MLFFLVVFSFILSFFVFQCNCFYVNESLTCLLCQAGELLVAIALQKLGATSNRSFVALVRYILFVSFFMQ